MLSEMIKRLRKDEGLYQSDLADALNVSQATVASWEKGSRRPDIETLIRIADYFNVTIDYLVGRTQEAKDYLEATAFENNPLLQKQFALKRMTYGFDSDQMDDMLDLAAIIDRRNKNGKANDDN